MTVADEYVAEVADELDGWSRTHATECLDEAERMSVGLAGASLLFCAAQPIMLLVLKLGKGDTPGSVLDSDAEWAVAAAFARREVQAHQAVGLDQGAAVRSLSLITRINSLIGDWPEPDWSNTIAQGVQQSVAARRSGRARGRQLRQTQPQKPEAATAGWFLRHPTDHFFRQALDAVDDAGLESPLREWIADFDAKYTTLTGHDFSAEEARADIVAEVRITNPQPSKWSEPISAAILHQHHGPTPPNSTLAFCQVEDPHATFNGTLISTLPGERWLIYGHLRNDGTTHIQNGTRRLQPTS